MITRLLVTLKAVLGISREKVTAVTCSLSLTPLSHSQADGDDHQQIQIFFLPLCRHTINLISILNSRLPGEDRILSARPFTCSLTLDHQISLSNQPRDNFSSTGTFGDHCLAFSLPLHKLSLRATRVTRDSNIETEIGEGKNTLSQSGTVFRILQSS